MKKILCLAVSSLILYSCTPYVQVYSTTSDLKKDNNQSWVYENDTLSITYDFWSLYGTMAFSIYNKLDKPIYIDWRKSAYVSADYKYDYWIDEEKYNAIASSETSSNWLLRWYTSTTTSISGSRIKPERITFIAPHSRYDKSTFYIYNPSGTLLNKNRQLDKWQCPSKPAKTIDVYTAAYTKPDSKLIFRNFLTISTSEKFETEGYIDNEFYISRIAEMKAVDFGRYSSNGDSAFKSPDCFYIPINNNVAIGNRKKMGMK